MGKPSFHEMRKILNINSSNEDHNEDDDSIIVTDHLVEEPTTSKSKTTIKKVSKLQKNPRKKFSKEKLKPKEERVFPSTSSDNDLIYKNKIGKNI